MAMALKTRKYQNAGNICQPRPGHLVDRLFAALSPWQCLLCREPAAGMDLCCGCLDDLPWLGQACGYCALPLNGHKADVCGSCAQDSRPSFDYCLAALAYEFPVDRMLTRLKFSARTEFARVLGELLTIAVCEHLQNGNMACPDLLVPVPLHPRRLASRGFNQAAEIAHCVARNLTIRYAPGRVKRIRHTPRQTGLSRSVRLNNIVGAFKICGSVMNKRVAIVDDVLTTLATTRELASRLRRAGAAEVQIWAVARTCS